MTWLLRLYPRAWRRRYAAEVAEMIAGRGFSLRTSVDLVAGAIDTWLHPVQTMSAATAAEPYETEEKQMLSRILRFDCAGLYGANLTKADQRKAGVAMIGWTLALTVVWFVLRMRIGRNNLTESMTTMPFMFALIYSMRYTHLKGRPASVQAIFIGGTTLIVAAILLAAGWIAAQI